MPELTLEQIKDLGTSKDLLHEPVNRNLNTLTCKHCGAEWYFQRDPKSRNKCQVLVERLAQSMKQLLDLAEQALLMKAALSPERAEDIAAEIHTGALEDFPSYAAKAKLELRAYAKAARGGK